MPSAEHERRRPLGTAFQDQAAATQTDHSEGYNAAHGGVGWVRLRDTNTLADCWVNLSHVVRVVHAAGSDFAHVVLVDGTAVEIWAYSTDHDLLVAAIGQMVVAPR